MRFERIMATNAYFDTNCIGLHLVAFLILGLHRLFIYEFHRLYILPNAMLCYNLPIFARQVYEIDNVLIREKTVAVARKDSLRYNSNSFGFK